MAENPDLVIVATGATPISLPIRGLDNSLTGEDVLTGKKDVDKRVCIIGGGMVGIEVAEFLVRAGHAVSVVELLEDVGRDMLPITRKLTLKYLADTGVEILTSTEISRFEGRQAFVVNEGKERLLGDFDSVVVAVGTRSVNELESLLRAEGMEVRVVGDAKKPRQIYDAVKDGFNVAIDI
jgi:pyruvate/2-oxoglutarate dehydrogenase complex dihydrolipoamide dehydrogenase (E3) component